MTSNGSSTGYPTPVLGVIAANDDRWLANFAAASSAHSVALDPADGHLFIPLPAYGIALFGVGRRD
jgi:hypothetical protein